MMSFNPIRSYPRAGCHTPAARSHLATPPSRLRFALLATLAGSLLFATACKRSEPTPAPKSAATQQSPQADNTPTPEELEKIAREREAFGLPLPPDASYIQRTDAYVTAYSRMKLPEIEAFYKSRLVDYEFIYPEALSNPDRKPRELHIIGLRAYMPKITVRFKGGKNGTASLDFRPPPDFAPALDLATDLTNPAAAADTADTSTRRREKGMPVLDRNARGELIAPGARWGEPYTPPKGTPLDTRRNSENFGRPYGEWQMP